MNTSPTPWTSVKREIIDANGKRVCLVASQACTVQEDVRNASNIVHVVNCHSELVSALENLIAMVQGECPTLLKDDHHFGIVTDALKKTKQQ